MRVETAIEEARALLAEEKFDAARRVLEPFADHPKAQYWLNRLEKSESAGAVVGDRMFTFSWNTALALGIIAFFAVIIVVIGVTV